MNIKQIAQSIADELRVHPERWTQGHRALNENGERCSIPEASCLCLMGHIELRASDAFYFDSSIENAFLSFRRIAGLRSIAEHNDTPGRTVQDIIDLCERVARS